jgi:hypothetical protein
MVKCPPGDSPHRAVVARVIVPTAELARMARQLETPAAATDPDDRQEGVLYAIN